MIRLVHLSMHRILADTKCKIVAERKFERYEDIYHFSNEGVCSWFDFTKMIAEIAENNICDVLPCHSYEFPSSVVRPSYSVLNKTKYKKTFGERIPYWTEPLKHAYII